MSQWRELNSIFKKQDRHILINYIYDYMNWEDTLLSYTILVINEFNRRGYKIRKWENFDKFNTTKQGTLRWGSWAVDSLKQGGTIPENDLDGFYYTPYHEHDREYLEICAMNLKEKYIRGQKDFTNEHWRKLAQFIRKEGIII